MDSLWYGVTVDSDDEQESVGPSNIDDSDTAAGSGIQ